MSNALQFLSVVAAGWINRHQQGVIEYLIEENRILHEQFGKRRLRSSLLGTQPFPLGPVNPTMSPRPVYPSESDFLPRERALKALSSSAVSGCSLPSSEAA